ncbi:SRPBCC domain-containing protein [Nocardioides gilvus]|uniref:SRPBCC domain-containing protein n=1 Tax=Nocardioides gilvus TaxID=1735589 RepID=UPI000D746B01|nr:SRPBCC domain-containing protein [Nocardioides gilvus]
MTTERRLAHSGFTLTRDYAVPVAQVWNAFANEDQKLAWFHDGDGFEPGEWKFDFRVGGRDIAVGAFHEGPVSRYEATYTDIVEQTRIVTTYDMWLDGTHMSTSVASFEFEPTEMGTRFTHSEHGVFLDQFWADGPGREAGSRGLLDALADHFRQWVA